MHAPLGLRLLVVLRRLHVRGEAAPGAGVVPKVQLVPVFFGEGGVSVVAEALSGKAPFSKKAKASPEASHWRGARGLVGSTQ